jgi:DNA-binding NtrC family response regulator
LPLREQRQVIPALASQFLLEFATRYDRRVSQIAPASLQALLDYDWPGNVRELRNVMERAVALSCGPELQVETFSGAPDPAGDSSPILPPEGLTGQSRSSVARTLKMAKESAELTHILKALRKHQNNRARAAAELGISRVTLYSKLRRHGLGAYKGDGSLPA